MSKKIGLIVLVLLALLLSACELSASTPPAAASNNQPQASPTLGGMNLLEVAASGTAVALGTGAPMDSTPALVILDATPSETPLAGLSGDTALPSPTTDPLAVSTPLPPQTDRPATYTLKEGEFIFCLARRFNVDPDQTLSLNGLWDSETIYPGLTVKIPATGSFPGVRALRAHPATYTVQTGDTIYSVACKYGDVEPMNIAAVNGLPEPYDLAVGAAIQIP